MWWSIADAARDQGGIRIVVLEQLSQVSAVHGKEVLVRRGFQIRGKGQFFRGNARLLMVACALSNLVMAKKTLLERKRWGLQAKVNYRRRLLDFARFETFDDLRLSIVREGKECIAGLPGIAAVLPDCVGHG